MPKNESHGHGKRDEAHERKAERDAAKVYEFAGNETNGAAQVRVVKGMVAVQDVDGVNPPFAVAKDDLSEVEDETETE